MFQHGPQLRAKTEAHRELVFRIKFNKRRTGRTNSMWPNRGWLLAANQNVACNLQVTGGETAHPVAHQPHSIDRASAFAAQPVAMVEIHWSCS
jgi:hypothetical protein